MLFKETASFSALCRARSRAGVGEIKWRKLLVTIAETRSM